MEFVEGRFLFLQASPRQVDKLGKVQREACKELYEERQIDMDQSWLGNVGVAYEGNINQRRRLDKEFDTYWGINTNIAHKTLKSRLSWICIVQMLLEAKTYKIFKGWSCETKL